MIFPYLFRHSDGVREMRLTRELALTLLAGSQGQTQAVQLLALLDSGSVAEITVAEGVVSRREAP
jgi:hypothetical protein